MTRLLLEGYEDRVKQVADQVFDYYHNSSVTKDQLRASIEARMHGIPLGSLKPAEFIKDVLKNLSTRMNLKKQPSDITKELDALALRMVSYVEDQIANQMPEVRLFDLPDLVYHRFKMTMDQIFYDVPAARKQTMDAWFDSSMWPRVERAFRKDQGVSIRMYVADLYDSMRDDLAHDAAMQGKQVEPYLQQMGFGMVNPYR